MSLRGKFGQHSLIGVFYENFPNLVIFGEKNDLIDQIFGKVM